MIDIYNESKLPTMKSTIAERVNLILTDKNMRPKTFSDISGFNYKTLNAILNGRMGENVNLLLAIKSTFEDINQDWLLTGVGNMYTNYTKSKANKIELETRPRIPLNAAAGSVSIALSGIRAEDCEEIPVVKAFANYNYTILVKGDSMEPEFHPGDELACMQIANATFIQWGRYHVLDTAQGVLVKRIYDDEEHILCRSEASDLYKDFRIPKTDIYNIALVIGMLRRY